MPGTEIADDCVSAYARANAMSGTEIGCAATRQPGALQCRANARKVAGSGSRVSSTTADGPPLPEVHPRVLRQCLPPFLAPSASVFGGSADVEIRTCQAAILPFMSHGCSFSCRERFHYVANAP
eukprot:2791743-Rhodomonas_salina.1